MPQSKVTSTTTFTQRLQEIAEYSLRSFNSECTVGVSDKALQQQQIGRRSQQQQAFKQNVSDRSLQKQLLITHQQCYGASPITIASVQPMCIWTLAKLEGWPDLAPEARRWQSFCRAARLIPGLAGSVNSFGICHKGTAVNAQDIEHQTTSPRKGYGILYHTTLAARIVSSGSCARHRASVKKYCTD